MSNIREKSIFSAIAAILVFLFLKPYFMWGLNKTTSLYAFLSILLLLVFFPNVDVKSKKRASLFVLFSFLLLLNIFYNNLNAFGIITSLCCILIPFSKEQFAKNIFNYFLTIYSVVIAISSVVWILSLMGIVNSIGIISPLNELKSYDYTVYPLLVQPNVDLGLFRLARFCGPFDEPGVIGTISALVLTIGQFDLRDKRLLTVFITGFFTMSFYYYVTVLVYYTVLTFTVNKNKRYGFFLLVILSFLVVSSLKNESMNETMWSRFMWDDATGTFVGDNRFKQNRLENLSSFELLFGKGKTIDFINATRGEYSLINSIVVYGILFIFAYIYLFVSYGWKYKKSLITYFLFLFVFVGCIYQRPGLFQPEYLFLFSLMAMNCGNLLENEKFKKNHMYNLNRLNKKE